MARIYGQDSRYTVCVNNDENFNMYETLNKAIGNIKAQMTDFERVADEAEQTEEVIPADPDVRNYTYTFFEGKLYYRENSEMVRKEVSQTAEERIRSLDEIRQITRELIDIQMDGCSEEELSDKQRLLNVKYDAFIKQYGAITSKANRIAFRDDSDYPLLCSLEEVNEDGEVKKADMFYKQTIKAKTVIDRVETAVEALNVSVNEFGYVNLAYMLSIYEPDITNAKEELAEKSGQTVDEITLSDDALAELRRAVLVEELDGLVFLNPDRYNENNPDIGWETADEYLSGNVRDKLRVAKAMAADTDNPQAERFAGNVAALEKVQPEWIEASDIDVKVGTTWIEPLDYEQFIYELLNTPSAIKETDRNIARTALLGKGLREAGQTAVNAFRTFADKPEVDYFQKEQKHMITKAVLAPMKAVRKLFVSIEIHLDASIDKLDNLAMDVRMDKEKNKDDMKHNDQMEADRKEAAPERVEAEIVYAPVVAETHEYQYNADAFEARGAADMKVEIGKEVSKVREDKAR